MNFLKVRFIQLVKLWLAGCAVGLLGTVQAADTGYDVDVELVEVAPQRADALRDLLSRHLELVRERGNTRVDAAQLQRLVGQTPDEAADVLATEGYYRPVTRVEMLPEVVAGRAKVRVRVMPGPQIRVGSVRIETRGAITSTQTPGIVNSENLRRDWLLPQGSAFRHADWERAKQSLVRPLAQRAFPLVDLTESRAEVDIERDRVDLIVTMDSGPLVRFDGLRVSGLARYPRRIVDRLNPIEPGEVYSQERLLELQRRLYESLFFERVDVSALSLAERATAGGSPDIGLRVPIDVRVTEFPRQRVTFGAGFSTNTGARAKVDYGRLNLLDRGLRFQGAVLLEQKQQSAQADLHFLPNSGGYSHSISAAIKREDIQGELVRGASLYGRRAWGNDSTERMVTLGLIAERRDISGSTSSNVRALVSNYRVLFRRTDDRFAPTRGYVLETQAGAGLRLTGGNEPFTRLYGRLVTYTPLGARNTLILRAEAGQVWAKDRFGIPSEWLFRAGGDQSVRGYRYQSLGVTQGNAIVGGRSLLLGSAELVHWLDGRLSSWGAATFVDVGDAADTPAALSPVVGYGAGVRWRSPVGLVNLDLAYGQKTRRWQLHFSMGVSF